MKNLVKDTFLSVRGCTRSIILEKKILVLSAWYDRGNCFFQCYRPGATADKKKEQWFEILKEVKSWLFYNP